ncbi:nuclear transport factor 2 family protein (plasmid) [Streptomyces sp. NBC_01450]|jgi:ketosteroid isomerase-like protein|uniref:nuclear transport factor 2 family protein n=1 Tax=Streptomyces sp. NBC_01450 TaxID=2903871 RepID=UPI002E36568F|nr:nuclear transport factor 2 family protein [Streptomyces sp. NBC_01450]
MDTITEAATTARPAPGWATAAGLVALTPPRSPGGEHGGPALDRLLIAERIARYGWAYDERDQAALAECFTADATWRATVMGEIETPLHRGAETIAAAEAALWPQQGDQRRHMFTNQVIDLSGDEATAHAYMIQLRIQDAASSLAISGAYRFHLRRETDGIWRIDTLRSALDNLT